MFETVKGRVLFRLMRFSCGIVSWTADPLRVRLLMHISRSCFMGKLSHTLEVQ
jgi:hypothetical protein